MNTHLFRTLLLLCSIACLGQAQAQPVRIVTAPEEGSITLSGVTTTEKAYVLYDKDDAEVVASAVTMFLGDIKAVTARTFTKRNAVESDAPAIIVGTIGQSAFIDQLIAEGKLDVTNIRGQWEAYGLATVQNPLEGVPAALVAYGSQPRSTAYALLEVSRLMGVSPWIWWADVTPAKKTQLYATAGKTEVGSPSVKFRGLFINDEDWGIKPWAAKKMDPQINQIGPNTYAKVMELLLRLRANTLWPAMHGCSRAFWFEKTNLPLINRYDIYMGSSHCEQMLRDNVYEWDKFGGHGNTDWNWATNRDMVKRYWAERVGESRGRAAIYTLGMRGVHDEGMNGYSSTADRVTAMTDILKYQRQLITDSLGDPTQFPQVFMPYKEVMDIYNAGLKVPDDVTLMWVDDNHGYIRQLPTPTEQQRSGGHGIYYHLSYLGTPNSYLWLSSISPMLISYELSKAYAQGVRSQWIINVGDIKPAEKEFEFCMDLAWDINSWTPDRAHGYIRDWAARTFSEDVADEIASIYATYYRLSIAAKPEHANNAHFDYSFQQMDQRIEEFQDIYNRAKTLKGKIPTNQRDAYYELVEYPIEGAADNNIKMLRAKQSIRLAWSGQRTLALDYAKKAQTAYNEIKTLTTKYNTGIASGKWEKIMDSYPLNTGLAGMMSGGEMPTVATTAIVSDIESPITEPIISITPGGAFTSASESVKALEGLGVAGTSATVWPLDMTAYKTYSSAPYAEYNVHVQKGMNVIQARCLPTFPLNTSYDLRIALSAAGKTPSVISIKTTAMTASWEEPVLQGFTTAGVHYESTEEKDITVRVYFMDPGLTVSAIASIPMLAGEDDLTSLITNPDFELNASGTANPQGTTTRQNPKGWRNAGTLSGNSWGVNQDAKHIWGVNAFWASASPLPNSYEFYQTIAASKLGAGTYKVTCLLGTASGKMGTARLFANKNVQYFGKESDYTSGMLTAGEVNTFAGHSPSGSSKMTLQPMQVYVTLKDGESLKLGIRTSNFKPDGTHATSDQHGWFKVDHFRLERVPDETDAIQRITEETAPVDQPIYDLQGRPITTPRSRTIYVQQGKKVLAQ